MSSELPHYLVVPFPEVSEVVDPWRERSTGSGPSNGVPAHVTLLSPCPTDESGIRELLVGVAAFDVEFRELRRFTEVPTLYLAPEPAEPFVELTGRLVEHFPDWLPYDGIHGTTVIPHLTVAQGPTEDEAERAVTPALPLSGRAREAILLAQIEPGRFETVARFPFEAA